MILHCTLRALLSRRAAACLSAFLVPLPGSAQAPAQPSAQATPQAKQEAPVLRVTTHLVQVNVVVQDKKGEPVADLTRDDFTLLDQGQPRQITSFSLESLGMLPAPPRALPAEFYSNRLEQREGTPTAATVILLDGLNTKFEDMAYARQQIIKFLGQLQPQDRVGLYTLTTKLSILQDFTSDAAPLLRALERYKGHFSTALAATEFEPANTGVSQIDTFLDDANQRVADFYTINRAQQTALALEAIANHVARLPGRKNLIWVSSGFPFYIGFGDVPASATQAPTTFNEAVEHAARALNHANLAVYPVDARGLISPHSADPSMSAASHGTAGPGALCQTCRGSRLSGRISIR